MRSTAEINEIKSRFTEPYSIYEFVNNEEISHLISLFNSNHEKKINKNTGPVTLNIEPFLDDPVIKKIFDRLRNEIGDFELNAGFFFKTDYPHIIHNDDTYELRDVYKGITIPLEIEGHYSFLPHLCFFDQVYFQGPAKFFYGDTDIPTYYNAQVYDYKDVEGLVDTRVDTATRLRYLTHLKPTWLTGLSFKSALEWKPTTALVFDSVRLHCASDFRKLGIKSKLGISLFTRKP